MEKLLTKTFFILIFLLGFILRFYQLNQIPSALNRDEPAIGYNAYSILKIGRDEWGVRFPIVFKSYGDYKSPLYIYLTTISVALFGLNDFSVRLWAAICGILILPVSFLLIRKLIRNSLYSISTMALIAFVPWAIFYSRFSYEANMALLFNFVALYFLVENNFDFLNWKICLFIVLGCFSYASSYIIWPIFLLIWLIYYLLKHFQDLQLIKLSQILIIFSSLLLIIFLQMSISGQKGRITIFSNPQIRLDFNKLRTSKFETNPLEARLFYNQYIYYGKLFTTNFIKIFDINFLFGGGGQHPWHKIPNVPHFYPILVLLIIVGCVYFLKSKNIDKKNKIFLMIFFLISIIPSAITIDSPHATRLLNFFLILVLLAGLGLGWLLRKLPFLGVVILLILGVNTSQFLKAYFIDYKNNPPGALFPGIKKAIEVIENNKSSADRIVFNTNADGNYVYLLFYTAYNPEDFLNKVKRYTPDTAGLEWVEYFDKYLFVDAPIPNPKYKEIYIQRTDNNIGFREVSRITSKFNNQLLYKITANYQ